MKPSLKDNDDEVSFYVGRRVLVKSYGIFWDSFKSGVVVGENASGYSLLVKLDSGRRISARASQIYVDESAPNSKGLNT